MADKRKSLFQKYVQRFFPKLQTLIEKINGKRTNPLTYLYKDTSILNKVYAQDNKWEATSVNTTYVAADFVALDSKLPIKSRPTLSTGNGKLPKSGSSRVLRESEITTLQVMEAQGGNSERIAKRLADDAVACDVGLDELMEYAFLSGFSNGYVALPDSDHENQMLRLNYGYFDSHTYALKDNEQITTADLVRVIENANDEQDTVQTIWISKSKFNELRKARDSRELVASAKSMTYTADTELPIPNSKAYQEAFTDEYNANFKIIDRTVVFEHNGSKKKVKPWNDNRVIFACNTQVGSFVYGQLAENTNRVNGVDYQLIDDFKLISKYSTTDPLTEKTSGQCIAAPIIEDVDQLYILDCSLTSAKVDETAEAKDTTDVKITYNGKTYDKAKFVTALNSITGGKQTVNTTDSKVLDRVNELSEEQVADLETAIASAVVTA
jgi:hypothetical protein